MTIGGWTAMLLSVGSVTLLLGWCIWKVFTTPGEEEHMHGFEHETPDQIAEEMADREEVG